MAEILAHQAHLSQFGVLAVTGGKRFYGHKTLTEVSLWQLLLGEKEVVFQGMFHFCSYEETNNYPTQFFFTFHAYSHVQIIRHELKIDLFPYPLPRYVLETEILFYGKRIFYVWFDINI